MRTALALSAALLLALAVPTLGRAEAPAGVTKWEYKTAMSSGPTGLDEANAAGKDGWELVAVRDGVLYMKRPLK